MASPLVEVIVNADSVGNETELFLRKANVEVESISRLLRESMNRTMNGIDSDVPDILKNLETIKANLFRIKDTLSHPVIIVLAIIVLFLVLVYLVVRITSKILLSQGQKHSIRAALAVPKEKKPTRRRLKRCHVRNQCPNPNWCDGSSHPISQCFDPLSRRQ
uniref:Transmembrane protein n=1 Tax=Steinernema glaseri TaxID=37863 RepID=A0A1I8AFT9_9BILA